MSKVFSALTIMLIQCHKGMKIFSDVINIVLIINIIIIIILAIRNKRLNVEKRKLEKIKEALIRQSKINGEQSKANNQYI